MIAFTGLKDGKHNFHFDVEDTFFEQFENSLIEGGKLAVDVELDKGPTMMNVEFNIKGYIHVMCDRCSDYFNYPVEGQENLIYKFSDEELGDEKIRCITSEEVEIDLAQPIYEFAALLLPQRRVHPEGECNEEMLNAMDEYLMVESQPESQEKVVEEAEEDSDTDPRWEALKKLKTGKK